jgi:hypothetical protein
MANNEMLNEFPRGCFNSGYYDDPGHQDFSKPITQWQPKVGEWIVNLINRPNNRPRLIEKHPIKTRCIVNDEDLKLEEVAVLFRPARLSDFAIKIPDYGKVWFVGIGNCIDIIGDDKDHCHEMSFYKYAPIKVWITTGLIDHYNIPVMPEELFKKLSEGK